MISDERKLELQERNLASLVKQGEPKFTEQWFPYTSGEVGPYYIQSVIVANDGKDYRVAIDSVAELIEGTIGLDSFDVIGGGETRDWDFSNPVAYALGKPHFKAYKGGKTIGDIAGKKVAWVADLNNEGSSMRDSWLPIVEKSGGEIVHAYFFVDRMEKGIQVMQDLGLPSSAVVPMDTNAWGYLQREGVVSDELYESLNVRAQDQHAWAINALLSNPEPLGKMLDNPETMVKGGKIMATYPEIKDELMAKFVELGFNYDGGQ